MSELLLCSARFGYYTGGEATDQWLKRNQNESKWRNHRGGESSAFPWSQDQQCPYIARPVYLFTSEKNTRSCVRARIKRVVCVYFREGVEKEEQTRRRRKSDHRKINMVAKTPEGISLENLSKRASVYIDPDCDLYLEIQYLQSRAEFNKCTCFDLSLLAPGERLSG